MGNRIIIPEPVRSRLAALRMELARRKLDAALILRRTDQRWLTGFNGEDGGLILTKRAAVLLTDGRFAEAAERETPWARKVVRKSRGPETIARELKRCGAMRIGFDPDATSVSTHTAIAKLIRPARLMAIPGAISRLRQCKSPDEVLRIRRAIDIAERAFEHVRTILQPGMTEREIAARLVFEMTLRGADGPAFPPIVAVGSNTSLPHYEPGDTRVTRDAPILIDWGARVDGYVSDLTRVFSIGRFPDPVAQIYRIVQMAHDRAIAAVRPGIRTGDLDEVARSHIRKSGFEKQFSHALGHGIGLDVHELPGIRTGTETVLESGMVITIEPGIYLPGVGGVRLEDDVLVTAAGAEVLSALPIDEV